MITKQTMLQACDTLLHAIEEANPPAEHEAFLMHLMGDLRKASKVLSRCMKQPLSVDEE